MRRKNTYSAKILPRLQFEIPWLVEDADAIYLELEDDATVRQLMANGNAEEASEPRGSLEKTIFAITFSGGFYRLTRVTLLQSALTNRLAGRRVTRLAMI